MGAIGDIVDFAKQIAREDDLKMRKHIRWEEFIVPLVQSKFNLKGRFDIYLRSMAKKEIQDFINEVEIEFDRLYLDYETAEIIRDDVTLHGDDDDENYHTIYLDDNNVYHAVSEKTGKVRYFTYVKPLEVIKIDHRDEILTYMFGKNYDKNEEVHGIDVFMQNKYCKEIILKY